MCVCLYMWIQFFFGLIVFFFDLLFIIVYVINRNKMFKVFNILYLGIDIRVLIKKIREKGIMLGKVVIEGVQVEFVLFDDFNKRNLVEEVLLKVCVYFFCEFQCLVYVVV